MVLSMVAVASASDYKITVTNTNTSVSIDGKTYTAYKLFDVTYTGSGKDDPHAYSIDSDGDGSWAWATLTNGVTADADGVYNCTTYGLKFTPSAADPSIYTIDSTMTDTQARSLADALGATSVTKPTTGKSAIASGETAVIDTEAPGYWLVYGTAKSKDPANDTTEVVAACALTTNDPTETVNPKVGIPTLDKKITGEFVLDEKGKAASAEVGSTIPFEIDTIVPDITGYTTYTFEINDTISNGLSFTGTDTANAINGLSITVDGGALAASKYTVTHTVGEKSFKITIPFATLQELTKGAPIVVTYSAIINEGALTTDYENNTASLTYSRNPYNNEDKDTTPDKKVYIIDINMDVDKYTGAATEDTYISTAEYEALSDEEKADYSAVENAEEGKEYKKPGSSATKLSGAEFKVFQGATKPGDNDLKWYKWDDTNKKVTWVAKAASDTFVSADGKFNPQVGGLEASKNGTKYGLLETKAPTGYNLLADPIIVTLTGAYNENGEQVNATITADQGTVSGGNIDLTTTPATQPVDTIPVENKSGTELPSTGGIGTTLFYVIGTLLVLSAGVLLVTKRKMTVK